jgi:hypothetical protein
MEEVGFKGEEAISKKNEKERQENDGQRYGDISSENMEKGYQQKNGGVTKER